MTIFLMATHKRRDEAISLLANGQYTNTHTIIYCVSSVCESLLSTIHVYITLCILYATYDMRVDRRECVHTFITTFANRCG